MTRPQMQRALAITRTTVGKKALVAITGVILFGFVIGHLAGNLLLFGGPDAYNAYAAGLKGNLPLLWGVRITLLVSVVVHIALTISLAGRNAQARSVGYKKPREDLVTTYAARTMVLSGPILLAYIVFHIAHFTAPGLSIGGDFNAHDVYANVVHGFRVWWVSAIYVFANVLLGLHLFHGGWSALQSLGANHPAYNAWRKRGAIALALLVSAGNVSFPIAVLTRVIDEDGGIPWLEALVAHEEEAEEAAEDEEGH
jgi:succinate dehydrogenase / fumarate reductase cytochrome b subunit